MVFHHSKAHIQAPAWHSCRCHIATAIHLQRDDISYRHIRIPSRHGLHLYCGVVCTSKRPTYRAVRGVCLFVLD